MDSLSHPFTDVRRNDHAFQSRLVLRTTAAASGCVQRGGGEEEEEKKKKIEEVLFETNLIFNVN